MEGIMESTITAQTGHPCKTEHELQVESQVYQECLKSLGPEYHSAGWFEHSHLNAQQLPRQCPNHHNHVSRTNYRVGLIKCQCGKFYVNK